MCRNKRYVFFSGCLILLSSCFLNQNNTSPPSVKKKQVGGVAILEEFYGAIERAQFLAGFVFQNENKVSFEKNQLMAIGRNSFLLKDLLEREGGLFTTAQEDNFAPQCTYGNSATASALFGVQQRKSVEFLNLGKLRFGLALQGGSGGQDVDIDEKNQYFKVFKKGIPSGLYQIEVEGSREISAMRSILSMPNPVQNLQVNKFVFDNKQITLKKSEGINIEWEKEQIENKLNQILFELRVKKEQIVHVIQCIGEEKQKLGEQSNLFRWSIASELLQKMPSSEIGTLLFLRRHILETQKDGFHAILAGMRENIIQISLQE